jgi:cytidylate kinase
MDPDDPPRPRLIGIVGPCGAGKTTLANLLNQHGYPSRAIAQEHSYVPAMWQKLTNPDFLIYLKASYQATTYRRHLDWTVGEYQEQLFRLRHAINNADLVIETDGMTPLEILTIVLKRINRI